MSGGGFDPSGSLPVGITKSVPEATQPLDHRRASTKNALEVLIGVLAWREFQLLGSHTIKLVDIGGVAVIHPCPIKNQLAHSLSRLLAIVMAPSGSLFLRPRAFSQAA